MNKQQFDELWKEYEESVEQRAAELWILIEAIQAIFAKRILEVGTANGGTLKFFEHAAGSDGKIVSIDHTKRPDTIRIDFSNPLCEIQLLNRDSQALETLEEVKLLFGNEPIDFLYIDGDHRYESVKKDFENYHGLVRPGGIIGFHDVNYPPVNQFWNEIDIPHKSKDHHNHGLGTGIIKL